MSQPRFAKELGFAARTIGNAERGTHPPSLAARRGWTRQWHLLVKTDNLRGPRYDLSGVLLHVQLLEELLVSARASARKALRDQRNPDRVESLVEAGYV